MSVVVKLLKNLPQLYHLQRTLLPIIPAHNPIAAIDAVPMPQEIPAFKFKLKLHPL
jgi:hypothetical protein